MELSNKIKTFFFELLLENNNLMSWCVKIWIEKNETSVSFSPRKINKKRKKNNAN
jgi:hypothetical protein